VSQDASGLIVLLVLIFMEFSLVFLAMAFFVMTDKKDGFDEAQARRDAEEILKDAANDTTYRPRVRAGAPTAF
jgi:nitrogen fixation-related uncharacterized protein